MLLPCCRTVRKGRQTKTEFLFPNQNTVAGEELQKTTIPSPKVFKQTQLLFFQWPLNVLQPKGKVFLAQIVHLL